MNNNHLVFQIIKKMNKNIVTNYWEKLYEDKVSVKLLERIKDSDGNLIFFRKRNSNVKHIYDYAFNESLCGLSKNVHDVKILPKDRYKYRICERCLKTLRKQQYARLVEEDEK